MRCRNCNHLLWELRARECPECGTGFRPSEHEFAVGGAAFCCPHCDQHYFGTGERGALVPRCFQCIGCQQQIDMDEMVVRPADRTRPDQGMVSLPWDEHSERGWMRATVALIGLALVLPLRLGTMLCGRSADAGGGVRFLLIVAVVSAIATSVPALLFLPIMTGGIAGAGAGAPPPGQMLGIFSGMIGAMLFFMILVPMMSLLIWAPTAHGILLMTGEVPGTFRKTFDALCFSGGAFIVSSIPCFGMYLGVPWWTVSAVMVLRNAQAVPTWRALLAALAFPVISVLAVAGLYIWLMVWAFTTAGTVGVGTMQTAVNQAQLSRLGERLLEERRDGRLPDHLLRPTARDRMPTAWLRDSSSDAATARRVAGRDLDGFASLPAQERMQLVDQAVAELIAPDAPHRVWDTVFLLPAAEIDPDAAGPNGPFGDLWLIGRAPFGPPVPWAILTLDAQYILIEPGEQAGAMQLQNELRSQAGLATITAPLHRIDERGAAVERETE